MDRCYVDQMILSELLLTFPQARLSGFRICPFFWRGRKGFLFPPPACREGNGWKGSKSRTTKAKQAGKKRGREEPRAKKKKREMDDEERTGRGDGGRLAVSLVRRRKGIKLTTGREEEAQKDGGRREGIGFRNIFFGAGV